MQQQIHQQQMNSITDTMLQAKNDNNIFKYTVNQSVNLFIPTARNPNDPRHPPKDYPIPKPKGQPAK